jgi:hypothetical protein
LSFVQSRDPSIRTAATAEFVQHLMHDRDLYGTFDGFNGAPQPGLCENALIA